MYTCPYGVAQLYGTSRTEPGSCSAQDKDADTRLCRHPLMTDLYCMCFTSKGTSEILVAGCQKTMFVIDVNKGEITKEVLFVSCDLRD